MVDKKKLLKVGETKITDGIKFIAQMLSFYECF